MATDEKEKLEIYVDDNGKRRDPNRSGHPILCDGTSRRTKQPCKNIARSNGKCRNHGGNATGPKTAEGKARIAEGARRTHTSTGEHVPIWFDMLTSDEQEMVTCIPNDAHVLLAQAIQLTTVRERRMLGHISLLQQHINDGKTDLYVQESWKRQLKRDAKGNELVPTIREDGSVEKASELVMSSQLVIKDDPKKQLLAIEDALTRVQTHKHKLIELQVKLAEGKIESDNGSLDTLNNILSSMREQRAQAKRRVDKGNSTPQG